MGVDDNGALPGLAEDFTERHDGDDTRIDDVLQDVPGTDGRKLVHVPHEDQGGPSGNGLEEVMHEDRVDHGSLVDDEKIHVEGRVLVFLKAPFLRLYSRRRCMVFASCPVVSLIRFAALPVGAASRIFVPTAEYSFRTALMIVVFPVPGPR